jgi:uncharacterized membrane protein
MLGYDWPRIHAMLVALPIALLPISVIFDLIGLARKSDALRRTGLVLLLIGTLGAGAAVLAGLQVQGVIDHGNAIHHLMEEHEHLAFYTLGTFAVVLLWRLWRDRRMGGGERIATFVLSLVGLGFLANTGHHGGKLVFEHAAGVSNETLRHELQDRAEGHVHGAGEAHEHEEGEADDHHHDDGHDDADHSHLDPVAPDSASTHGDTPHAASHTHPPGTPPHRD